MLCSALLRSLTWSPPTLRQWSLGHTTLAHSNTPSLLKENILTCTEAEKYFELNMSDHNCNDDITPLTMIDDGEADGDMIDGVETAEDTAVTATACENYEL